MALQMKHRHCESHEFALELFSKVMNTHVAGLDIGRYMANMRDCCTALDAINEWMEDALNWSHKYNVEWRPRVGAWTHGLRPDASYKRMPATWLKAGSI